MCYCFVWALTDQGDCGKPTLDISHSRGFILLKWIPECVQQIYHHRPNIILEFRLSNICCLSTQIYHHRPNIILEFRLSNICCLSTQICAANIPPQSLGCQIYVVCLPECVQQIYHHRSNIILEFRLSNICCLSTWMCEANIPPQAQHHPRV